MSLDSALARIKLYDVEPMLVYVRLYQGVDPGRSEVYVTLFGLLRPHIG